MPILYIEVGIVISKDTIGFINAGLKYSIKAYFPLQEKILLYDVLVFLSIVSQTQMFCSQNDIDAFHELVSNCKELDISLEAYISCAYKYISKYLTPGHRIGVSYFLNDSVVEYCGTKIKGSTGQGTLNNEIKDDLLSTEKSIRDIILEDCISYDHAFAKLLKQKRISPCFLAYKKFCNSPLVSQYASEYFDTLIEILEPFFTCILAKNQIFTPYKVKSWNNSKIEDFNFCPIFFKDRYITNILPESILGNASSNAGTKVHAIFEDVLTKYNKNKIKDLAGIANRYFKSDTFTEVEEELKDHIIFVKDMLTNKNSLLNKLLTSNSEILIEHTMNAVLNSINFVGTADLIIINGTSAHILDYKSSKLDPKYLPKNNTKYTKQLSLYAKLLLAERPELTSVQIIILYTRGLIQPLEINNTIHLERGIDIDSIKNKLKSGMLTPNKMSCFLCRHCDCKHRYRDSIWNEDGSRK